MRLLVRGKILLVAVLFLCGKPGFCIRHIYQLQSTAETQSIKKVTYKIIPAASNTWGYDIYLDGKLTVHQLTRPAIAGNNGFKSRADAEKVAKLVVEKIKNNQMPPTVTISEMKKLKVLD